MSKQTESLSEKVLIFIVALFNIIFKLYLIVVYWEWFIVPLLANPTKLTMPLAYGITAMIGVLYFSANRLKQALVTEAKYDGKNVQTISKLTLHLIITSSYLITWGISAIVSSYV